MILSDLISSLQEYCNFLGYDFNCGNIDKSRNRADQLPFVWCEIPEIENIEGYSEGQITYKVSMYFINPTSKFCSIVALDAMQQDAISVVQLLRHHSIISKVNDIEINVDFSKFVPISDISVHLEANIIVDFIKG